MSIKSIVKIVILSILTIIIVWYGVVFYQRLNFDRKTYDVNIYTYIPQEAKQVLQVNKVKDFSRLEIFLGDLMNVLSRLEFGLEKPYYVANLGNDAVILSKLNSSQQTKIREHLDQNLYSEYPPQKKKYNGVDILFYTTSQKDIFFVCTFLDGVFVAGYDYRSIEKVIDTKIDNAKGLFTDKFFRETSTLLHRSAPILLFVNNDSVSFSGEMIYNAGLSVEGYQKIDKLSSHIENKDSLNISYSIFPNSFAAFKVARNLSNFNDSLSNLFQAPYYQFYTNNSTLIYLMSFSVDRYELYDILNKEERKYSKTDLTRHGYTFGKKYSIYSGSKKFSKNIFKNDNTVYFAFKDGCMIYSLDKQNVTDYILNSGGFVPTHDYEVNPYCEIYAFSKNVNKYPLSRSFKDYNLLVGTDTVGMFQAYKKNKFLKLEIDLNNSESNLFNQ